MDKLNAFVRLIPPDYLTAKLQCARPQVEQLLDNPQVQQKVSQAILRVLSRQLAQPGQ